MYILAIDLLVWRNSAPQATSCRLVTPNLKQKSIRVKKIGYIVGKLQGIFKQEAVRKQFVG